MVGESFLSWRSGLISEQCFLRARDGIARAGLPVSLPAAMAPAALRALMARDKKNVGSEVRLALLEALGRSVFDRTVSEPLLSEALELIQPDAGRHA
jgi:3-dehydroquinate synthetase